MIGQLPGWATKGCGVVLVLSLAVGCTSVEDRIENVITHELEKCQQSEEEFHEVSTRQGTSFEVLSELCHLEASEVEMTNEWRGTIRTGPLVWMAEEDQEERAVMLRRVAWDELDRALSFANRSNRGAEDFESAERHFAAAEEQYADSQWVRVQRLENLLDFRADSISSDDEQSLVGDDAEAYVAEFIEWAQGRDDQEAAMQARMMVIDHVNGYISRQERAISTLGSRDGRLEAAAEHAEEGGDAESAREYREELKQRQEDRPEAKAQLEKRIVDARREGCEYVDALNVDGVDEEGLRTRISSTMRSFDCDFSDEEEEDGENGDD